MGGLSRSTVEEIVTSKTVPLLNRIKSLEIDLSNQKNLINHLMEKIGLADRRHDDTEQYLMRQNLIIDGVPFRKNETPDSIRDLVTQEIDNLGLEIDDSEVDRAHRIESAYRDEHGQLRQPVIVRFVSWGARNVMYQARRNSRYRMRAHLTSRRDQILEDGRRKIRNFQFMRDNIPYVFADKNCRLQAKCTDGRILGFSAEIEFDSLIGFLEGTTTMKNKLIPELQIKYGNDSFGNADETYPPDKPDQQRRSPAPASNTVDEPSYANVASASSDDPSPTKPLSAK